MTNVTKMKSSNKMRDVTSGLTVFDSVGLVSPEDGRKGALRRSVYAYFVKSRLL